MCPPPPHTHTTPLVLGAGNLRNMTPPHSPVKYFPNVDPSPHFQVLGLKNAPSPCCQVLQHCKCILHLLLGAATLKMYLPLVARCWNLQKCTLPLLLGNAAFGMCSPHTHTARCADSDNCFLPFLLSAVMLKRYPPFVARCQNLYKCILALLLGTLTFRNVSSPKTTRCWELQKYFLSLLCFLCLFSQPHSFCLVSRKP